MSAYLQTQSGRVIDVTDPKPEDIDIGDIAHALSQLCRFGGHTSRFYSVAEHSVRVSSIVPPEHALQGLLHDATEAYLVDMPSPIKRLLPEYYLLEQRLWHVIADKFGVPREMHESVKEIDARICISEKIALVGGRTGLDSPAWLPLTSKYSPLHAGHTLGIRVGMQGKPKERFLQRFGLLMRYRV